MTNRLTFRYLALGSRLSAALFAAFEPSPPAAPSRIIPLEPEIRCESCSGLGYDFGPWGDPRTCEDCCGEGRGPVPAEGCSASAEFLAVCPFCLDDAVPLSWEEFREIVDETSGVAEYPCESAACRDALAAEEEEDRIEFADL